MKVQLHTPHQIENLGEDEYLGRLGSKKDGLDLPFCQRRILALHDLGNKLMRSPHSASAPQILALGFWLRKSALKRIQQDMLPELPDRYAVPRGLAFHLPPANVDTLFAYSWALSFLAGNQNVVRLPSQMNPVAEFLVKTILSTLEEHELVSSQHFVFFDKASTLMRDISARSDLRVIWGGDAKILDISRDPVRPDGLSLGFSDRKSICIVSAKAFAEADIETRQQLATKMYNDLYWFDQLGCGSPRAVLWLGDHSPEIRDEFYSLLQTVVKEKNEILETGIAISKFVFGNEMAGVGLCDEVKRYSNELTILKAEIQPGILESTHGGGILFDCKCNDLHEMSCLVQPNLQTITQFGLSDSQIETLKSIVCGTGGYRIVPVGDALSFAPIWDGMNLIAMFTRLVTVQK